MDIIYPRLKAGEYWGRYINDVPILYLIWLFRTLSKGKSDYKLFFGILNLFLSHSIRIEEINKKYYFFFNDIESLKPPGVPREFLISNWRGINTKGEYVYEIKHTKYSIFIVENKEGINISSDYVSHKYLYGGDGLIYERNEQYYFKDINNNIIDGAYVLRKPYLPNKEMEKQYFKNEQYKLLI